MSGFVLLVPKRGTVSPWGEWIRSDTPPSIELGGESEFMLRRAVVHGSTMLGASCVSELSISICVCGSAMLGALLVMVSCMRE